MSASSPAQPYTPVHAAGAYYCQRCGSPRHRPWIAAVLKPGAAERDRTGIVPAEIVSTYSNSGLWGITVPRRFGGAEVSAATLAQVIAILSAADPSLGQIPQNHYCLLEDIRLQGSDDQQAFFSPGITGLSLRQCPVGNRGKRSLIFVPVSRKAQTVCGSMVVKATAPARCTPTGLAFWRWTPTIAPSSLSSPEQPGADGGQ